MKPDGKKWDTGEVSDIYAGTPFESMMIIAAGRISTHMWESESGKKNYSTDVTVSEISFGESKKMGQGDNDVPDDMPF